MYELGLSDGEAKGRRLERQALMLAMPVLIRKSGTAKFSLPLRNWLASRSKRGKVGK
jgi:hypothetical protein